MAGLFTALHLPENIKILIITKDELEKSNSFLAQGGISTLRDEEDYDAYFEDTMRAGKYENDKKAVDVLIRSSRAIIKELIKLGVDFDKEGEELSYTREGAHSINRILHHKDITGKEITSKLIEKVLTKPNITIKTHATMIDIVSEENKCRGILIHYEGMLIQVDAKTVVLATGGIGGLFKNSTNFPHITGDGVAVAIKNGVKVKNINYIQIHPTCLYTNEKGRRFLISEALRGEGAVLLNIKKQRFIDELLPRDVVSLAIQEQMTQDKSDYVYLSLMHLPEDKIRDRFPNIYDKCLEEGYDLSKDLLPVTPAQHYFMGGVETDINGKTSMQYLYCVGEASCTGVHGANRLASNSLLEGLVFARRAAGIIQNELSQINKVHIEVNLSEYDIHNVKKTYRELVLNEIKRRDEKFYAKWCSNVYKCG